MRKDRAIIRLSRGGSDATVAREFDLDAKRFIPAAEGGFELPEAKTQICYKERDVLLKRRLPELPIARTCVAASTVAGSFAKLCLRALGGSSKITEHFS